MFSLTSTVSKLIYLVEMLENNVPTQVIMNHQGAGDYGDMEEEEGEPYFAPASRTNISSVVGAVARLGCSVQNLGDKTVSGRL